MKRPMKRMFHHRGRSTAPPRIQPIQVSEGRDDASEAVLKA